MGLETKYQDLVFLAQISEKRKKALPWPKFTDEYAQKDHEVLYVYGFSPEIGPLLDWVEADPKRDLVFLEDDIAVVQKIVEEGFDDLLGRAQIHLKFQMEGVSLEEFASAVVKDFPFEKLGFVDLKGSEEKFPQLKLELMRKSVIEIAVHNEMIHYHKLFYNLEANFKRLDRAFDVGKWRDALQGKPAIICGAGPSLSSVMDKLREMDNRALIFAGGSAIVALNARKIFPHMIFAIDPNVEEFTRLGLHTAFQTPMIYGNRVRPEIFDSFVGPAGYLVTGTGGMLESWLEEQLGIEDPKVLENLGAEALSVTCVSLMCAIYFGCNPIIFAGVDLSYGDGKRYPDGVLSDLHCSLEESDSRVSETLHVAQGKITATKWIMERDVISDVIAKHPGTTFIDATRQGLLFDNLHITDDWTHYCKEVFDIRSLIHEKVMQTPLAVEKEGVKKALSEFRRSLENCKGLVENILLELKFLFEKKSDAIETAKMIVYEMELQEEVAYSLVLAQVVYALTFPISRECRIEKEGASQILIKSRLYGHLKSIIDDYLTYFV